MFSLLQSQNTLEKVPITITLPSTNIIYTGTAIDTSIETNNSNAVYGIKVNGGSMAKMSKGNDMVNTNSVLELGFDVGSSISYTIEPLGDENYTYVLDGKSDLTGTFTIVPATLNLTASITSFTYNGASQNLSYNVTGTGVDTGYSVSNTSGTNAGSYTATLTKSSTNYVLGTSTIPWSISKAALTITSNNASMTYGSSLPTFGYTPSGFLGSDTSSVITGSVTHSTTGSSTANAGTYAIVPNISGLSATNYTFTASNGTLTISAATLNLSGAASQSFIYNGLSRGVSFSVTGAVASDTGYLVSNTSNINVGSYTATLTKSSSNYVLGATTTIPWSITPAALTTSITSVSVPYNGSSQQVFVFGTVNGTSSGGTATGTNAGTYPVTINGTGNYSGSISGNLFITQLQGGVTFKPAPYADIAPGDNSVISFSSYVQSQTGPISFSASASGDGSGDAIITSTSVQNNNSTTAGFVVTIVASAADTTNYINFSSTITIKFYGYVAPPPPVGQQE